MVIEEWRRHYNIVRPHSCSGYRPSALETIVPPSWPFGTATPTIHFGRETTHTPTLNLDPPPGADQSHPGMVELLFEMARKMQIA